MPANDPALPEGPTGPFSPPLSSMPEEAVTYEQAELVDESTPQSPAEAEKGRKRFFRRRVRLPIILFLLTCFSTFLAGATNWDPGTALLGTVFQSRLVEASPGVYVQWPVVEPDLMPLRRVIYQHWDDGLIYMLCLLAILMTHEMGHFVMTVVYRVRASLPYFLPLPISPIGTLGAVIAMDGQKANRREIFDIGLAGPIAGLIVAIPITWIGVRQLNFEMAPSEGLILDPPLAMRLLMHYLNVTGYDAQAGIAVSQANAFFLAGWVGLLVTGLNMMPVSQLDGGHVTYALFGKGAHWLARGFMIFVFAYMAFSSTYYWVPMALLVLLIGIDHPPTSDDKVRIGPVRTVIGLLSLLIPILCFIPGIRINDG